jgi:acetyl esterase/lipase
MRLALLAALSLLLAACSPTRTLNGLAVATSGAAVTRDLAFGPDPRQRLDVYAPKGEGAKPVLVFLYGGSWNSGDRGIYGFAGGAFASRGFVTVIPDYRLVPQHAYPAFLEDSALAVRWARDNARRFGGDPDRIVLVGHSAGAYNAAMVALDPRWLRAAGVPASAIKGWAGLAGPYDFLPLDDDATIRTFSKVENLPSTQPINHVSRDDPPVLLVTGADDTTVAPKHTLELARRLQDRGVTAETRVYPRVGHVGLVLTLAGPLRGRAPVLDDVATFLRRASAGEAQP